MRTLPRTMTSPTPMTCGMRTTIHLWTGEEHLELLGRSPWTGTMRGPLPRLPVMPSQSRRVSYWEGFRPHISATLLCCYN